jgi:hypothetical protein
VARATATTIALDRAKAERARELPGANPTSAAVGGAQSIRAERLRPDAEAHRRLAQTGEDLAVARPVAAPYASDPR